MNLIAAFADGTRASRATSEDEVQSSHLPPALMSDLRTKWRCPNFTVNKVADARAIKTIPQQVSWSMALRVKLWPVKVICVPLTDGE